MNMPKVPTVDLDSFLKELEIYKGKGYQLSFSGLTYYRPKQRADKLVQIEFNETVYLDSKGRVVVENH